MAEGAFVAVRLGDRLVGAPGRAVSYNANVWEAPVQVVGGNYTYFVPLTREMSGKGIEVVALVMKDGVNEIRPEAWVTAYPNQFASK
jgi:ureidoglycolate hydrolase